MAKDLTKRLYVENVEGWKNHLSKEKFFDEKLEVKVVERAVVLPSRRIDFGLYTGGVCDENLNFVAGYWRKRGGGSKKTFNCLEESYTVNKKSIVKIDEDVIFGGLLGEHFGHFLTECFCRLWYVLQNPDSNSKIVFVTTLAKGRHRSYTNDFFKLMGIDEARIIYVDKPMQFRSITIPEQAQYDYGHLTKEFLLPYEAIKSRVTPGNLKKIYLTRTGFEFKKKHGNVHCFNEKYFEDFFKARGFEIVSPEKLKVAEQISLIMGADEIAANLGTLTHFGVFCKPDAKFIMINRTSRYISRAQAAINDVFNLDYYIIDGSKNFLYADRTHGVCLFGANKYWTAFVADYFGEQIGEDDDRDYLEETLDKYVDFWYGKYADTKEKILESLKKVCRRLAAIDTPPANRPLLSYQTHAAFKGWSAWLVENSVSNDIDKRRDIQAIKITFPTHDVYYAVYFNDKEGWSEEVGNGEQAGTTGKSKPIYGIRIRLDEAGAEEFDICYRVHTFDGTWTAWAKNGEEIISRGVKLNAIQIKLQNK